MTRNTVAFLEKRKRKYKELKFSEQEGTHSTTSNSLSETQNFS